jgi:hypothetical protein
MNDHRIIMHCIIRAELLEALLESRAKCLICLGSQ